MTPAHHQVISNDQIIPAKALKRTEKLKKNLFFIVQAPDPKNPQ
jgi:hypothetical protein